MRSDWIPNPRTIARRIVFAFLVATVSQIFAGEVQADSRGAIEADYRAAIDKADQDRIDRLIKLAATQKGLEAEATYLEVFRFAIGTDRYQQAEPAAERALSETFLNREVSALAYLVNIIAEADRGAHDEAMRDLRAFVDSRFLQEERFPEVQVRTVLAIGEALVRRLLQGGRFDDARQVCELIIQRTETPAVREHFEGYVRRLRLVGKPAPAIEGRDVDGDPVSLEKLKGKVVLVVFWATWCPPCVENLPYLTRAAERYEKQGFTVLGVNVDEGADREKLVQRFIVEFAIPWPSVMNGQGDADFAKTYDVKEIPASVLVGRDGKVITFDLTAAGLMDAVGEAVGDAQTQGQPKP